MRGRDIQRYRAKWAGLWLISTFPALTLKIEQYPAVKRHLLRFGKSRLEQLGKTLPNGKKSRKKTLHAWYELQDTCAYYEVFDNEKLIWMDLTKQGRIVYDIDGYFCLNTAFVMSGKSLKYLCAILNSKLSTWFMSNTSLNSGMGVTRWINASVKTISVPKISEEEQQPYTRLVDQILMTKEADSSTSVPVVEAEIDRLIFELYGLNASEVSIIEGMQ